jgi:hypothetical protein
MNLNTNTKKLTLTKTERGYIEKARSILCDLIRLAPLGGPLADAADRAVTDIETAVALLDGKQPEVER